MSIYNVIDNAIAVCDTHIQSLDPNLSTKEEIEFYLVSGLVTLIVSEYEEHLESVFHKRAESCGDPSVTNYIKKTLDQKFRSPDISKINTTLNNFDSNYKRSFWDDLENSQEHAAWDSLMKARHAIVHKKGTLNLTFLELKTKYSLTKKVIQKLESVLSQ